jgi:hypothetical protein
MKTALDKMPYQQGILSEIHSAKVQKSRRAEERKDKGSTEFRYL